MSSSPNSSSSSDAAVTPAALTPIEDVLCNVDVVLGTAWISVRECLNLKRQALIRLEQFAGADMQIVVNGVAVANGEAVIIDDSTAIRITDILAPPSNEATE